MDRTLLIVDDEENILATLMRVFRRDGYRILRANSGQAGLELLAQHPVCVIISDQRMPHMSGAEFLSKVKSLYPHTVRIMLSGYSDLQSLTDAINKGEIYKFLTKPWDDEFLRENVREAFQYYEYKLEKEKMQDSRGAMNLVQSGSQSPGAESEKDVEQRIARAILEALPLPILALDEHSVICMANHAACARLGREHGETVGRNLPDVLPPAAEASHILCAEDLRPALRFFQRIVILTQK